MSAVNAPAVAGILAARLGLAFTGSSEEVEGGAFAVIRPLDLPRPNGFGVLLARTPRLIEASFRPDAFARSLLRQMSEASESAQSVFAAIAAGTAGDGYRVSISINGNSADPQSLPAGTWEKVEIDCDRRLPAGKLTPKQLVEHAADAASACLSLVLTLLAIEEATEAEPVAQAGLPEGARQRIEVNRYERSPANRAACIAHYGVICQACGFDFSRYYGELGSGYVEVHHRTKVSAMGGSYLINPIADLIPVCANCHAMLHRRDPPLEIEQLRELLHSDSSQTI